MVPKRKYQRSTPIARERPGRIGKKTQKKTTCKPVEQEENHKKAQAGPGPETKWEMSI
jgi:hypothetical protein